jgi:hypothetical protein
LSITAINVYRVINHDIDRSHTLRHLIDARSFITTLLRPFQQALLNSSRQRSSGPLLLWFSLAAPDGFRACIGFCGLISIVLLYPLFSLFTLVFDVDDVRSTTTCLHP